ncbi:hypothetical protein Lal_00031869 [Lupinus albus]|nr:hypothetical protein Lal_00031869 [Lupinus albus]
MGKLWILITLLHSIAGYASVVAIESPSTIDDEQWLAYWIIYSFLTLGEMVLQLILEIPFWYDVKLLMVAWLVLPQFKGASYLYERFVREYIRKRATEREHQQILHQPEKKSLNVGKTKKTNNTYSFRFIKLQ